MKSFLDQVFVTIINIEEKIETSILNICWVPIALRFIPDCAVDHFSDHNGEFGRASLEYATKFYQLCWQMLKCAENGIY